MVFGLNRVAASATDAEAQPKPMIAQAGSNGTAPGPGKPTSDENKFTYVLVLRDHYTKYAVTVPTRNQDARTVARALVDSFIVHYGIPTRLHSDQGGAFEGKVIKHFCKLLGIVKSHTTPYHPEGNGATERMNRTLLSFLRTLDPDQKATWKYFIASHVHAYNCCRHESTGLSPFYLMFGRSPRLPIDIFLGKPAADNCPNIVQ